MTSAILGNLDISISIVRAEKPKNCRLNYDGTIKKSQWSLWSYFPGYEKASLTPLVGLFTQCADHWVALKNSTQTKTVQACIQEFNHHIQRIQFLGKLIFDEMDKWESYPDLKGEISTALFHLLPMNKPGFRESFPISVESLQAQIDPETLWRLQESSLFPLTEELLRIPTPQKEIWELPEQEADIFELPALYQRIVNPKKPSDWFGWITYWIIYLWKGHHSKGQESLQRMCETIRKDRNKSLDEQTELSPALGNTEQYLKQLVPLYKSNRIPLDQVSNSLQELAYAANQCHPEWSTQSETQFRSLTRQEITLQDKALQWKAEFVQQQLLCFFRLNSETAKHDSHNANLMNILDYYWGEQLGRPGLKAPSTDIYAAPSEFQWESVVRFLKQEWERGAIVDFLKKKWEQQAVQSFCIYVQANNWDGEIGQFLANVVREKKPLIKDPQEFVLEEYFTEGLLNQRGAVRCLLESLPFKK